jgi:cobyrinic acid a,c-diamide synthase
MRALVVAGTHSGVGKTSVSIALMAAYRRRGLVVQGFKVGPDFIDPGFHQAATGRPGRNLDGWMLDRATVCDVFNRGSAGADLTIVEGVMGLFDGASGLSESGSTAEMAKWLDLPVALVIDAGAMARSAAALVHGFETFDPALNLIAVIANNVAGTTHYRYIEDAIRTSCRAQAVGWLGHDPRLEMPERHLGLVTAEEVLDGARLDLLADWVENGLDLNRLLDAAGVAHFGPGKEPAGLAVADDEAGSFEVIPKTSATGRAARPHAHEMPVCSPSDDAAPGPPVEIGVARDRAFCFYYQENLELMESLGAKLIRWSPLTDPVPEGVRGLYFGGGYPELYAERLASNRTALEDVRKFIAAGGFVYAECGGLMYLTEAIVDTDGTEYRMAGVLPARCRMRGHLAALGYAELAGTGKHMFLPEGQTARGHQFRYSDIDCVPQTIARAYVVRGAGQGENTFAEGYCINNCLASYVHVHFLSNPGAMARWLDACRESSVTT